MPVQLVKEYGGQITFAKIQLLWKSNGIKHITKALFHPVTNNQADRFVQSFKHAIKCEKQSTNQTESQHGKVPFGLPEHYSFDDGLTTVRVVFGQTTTYPPGFG